MPLLNQKTPEIGDAGPNAFGMAALLLGAMVAGAVLSLTAPGAAEGVASLTDATLMTLIFLLFFELRIGAVATAYGNLKFLSIAWLANFILVPAIAFAIASLLVSGQPLLFAGLMLYFLAPCTDWFLGFTRMAHGNTELGAALIPINLITQVLLFPLWLWLFAPATGLVDYSALPGLLLQWFVLPMALAQGLRGLLHWRLPAPMFKSLLGHASRLTTVALAVLILQIFAGHVGAIVEKAEVFGVVALAVFLFFAVTFVAGRALTSAASLPYPEHALLAMTTAARNAPLVLALTAVAVPDQPIILAVIVFGMLVEIPHLTALRQLLLRRRELETAPQTVP